MNKFTKLFHYYLTSYWNNSRTLSSMYSFLKIFFERNNKIDSTVAVFGNVFRNSKWNNLQIQNVKKSFIKQWLWFFCFIVFFGFYIFTYSNETINLIYLNLFFFKQTLHELITNIYYLIGCTVFQILQYWNRLFLNNQINTINKSLIINNNIPHQNNTHSYNFNSNSAVQSNLNLFFLQKTLPFLNNTSITLNSFNNKSTNYSNLLNSFIDKIHFSSINSTFNSVEVRNDYVNYEVEYKLSTQLNSKFNNYISLSQSLSDSTFNENTFNYDPSINEYMISNPNNIAKQQRWLTRNFWSNQNLISDSNKFSQVKSFLQNPLTNVSALDQNIWLSNKLYGFESEKTSAMFSNNLPNYNLLKSFNFFEDSRFFLNQRYSYLNQLSNQQITLTSNLNENTILDNASNTSYIKFQLIESLFLRNFNKNIYLYSTNQLHSNNFNNLNQINNNSITNLFVTTNFNDLLQNNDLRALNSFNSSSNNSYSLPLNLNSNSSNYKS